MSLNADDQAQCRFYLELWARWLLSNGGWSHRSPSDRWSEQVSLGHSGFYSTIPHGVEPGTIARQSSVAMRELRERDSDAASIIDAVYLSHGNASIGEIARRMRMTPAGLNSRRKRAEWTFYTILRTRSASASENP